MDYFKFFYRPKDYLMQKKKFSKKSFKFLFIKSQTISQKNWGGAKRPPPPQSVNGYNNSSEKGIMIENMHEEKIIFFKRINYIDLK